MPFSDKMYLVMYTKRELALLPYSELKEIAKKIGIPRVKREYMVALILSIQSGDELETDRLVKALNRERKNKVHIKKNVFRHRKQADTRVMRSQDVFRYPEPTKTIATTDMGIQTIKFETMEMGIQTIKFGTTEMRPQYSLQNQMEATTEIKLEDDNAIESTFTHEDLNDVSRRAITCQEQARRIKMQEANTRYSEELVQIEHTHSIIIRKIKKKVKQRWLIIVELNQLAVFPRRFEIYECVQFEAKKAVEHQEYSPGVSNLDRYIHSSDRYIHSSDSNELGIEQEFELEYLKALETA